MSKIRTKEQIQPLTDKTVYIENLLRASRPILVVEGNQDEKIYGWIASVTREKSSCTQTLSIDSTGVGGRPALLELYEELKYRRKKLNEVPVIFIADKDMWVFTGVPDEYVEDIVCTTGYCIENDLYAGVNLRALLEPDEAQKHSEMLKTLIEWFAFGVEQRLKNAKPFPKINVPLKRLIPDEENPIISSEYSPTSKPSLQLLNRIDKAYELELPGKLLFQLILHFTTKPGRKPNLNNSSLLESAFRVPSQHKYRDELIDKIKIKFDEANKKIVAKR